MFRRLIPLAAAIATAALLLSTAASAQAMFVFNSHWGGTGVIAHWHDQDLCQLERLSPGSHKVVIVHSLGFDHIVSYGGQYRYGTLMCARQFDVWGHTTGPWENGEWISLRCPDGERPINGGVGYTTRRVGEIWPLAQVGGGFGHNHDGYWHYRFHNHIVHSTYVRLWAVCVNETGRVWAPS